MTTNCALVPTLDRIVVRQEDSVKQTPGGLYIPDIAEEKPNRGVVLAVGPGRRTGWQGEVYRPRVEVGDSVYYIPTGAHRVKCDGEELLILDEGYVLAVVKRENL